MSPQDPFLKWIYAQIPLTRSMQIDTCVYKERSLTLSAPKEPNKNDKNTGFAGATTALATLAGWCLITRYTQDLNLDCDVMIVESQVKYLAPITQDFTAQVTLPEPELCKQFDHQMAEKGRSRMTLEVIITENGCPALTLTGSYLARLK